jgi:small ligand-binding sensory domain FIST
MGVPHAVGLDVMKEDFPSPPRIRAASRVLLSTWDEEACVQMARGLREKTGGAALALVFLSCDWHPHLAELVEVLQLEGRARRVVGCCAGGFIGTSQEDEQVSGCSVMFLGGEDIGVEAWPIDEKFQLPENLPDGGGFFLLGDPLRLNATVLVEDLAKRFPDVPVFGGLASGAGEPEELFVFADRAEAAAGVLVHLSGVQLRGVVSQGCQPIGEPFTITRAQGDLVMAVGGRPAYEVLVEAVESLSEEGRIEARGNVMVGLAASEYVDDFRRGDFLVRNIIGGDPSTGALRLGALPRIGQTLQFQIRERDAADEDMRQRCAEAADRWGNPAGALLFSCAGRGTGLFGVPNHDAGLVADAFGPVPLCGFFCSGEIGPVGPRSFLHGYTASLALIYPVAKTQDPAPGAS